MVEYNNILDIVFIGELIQELGSFLRSVFQIKFQELE